MQITAMRAVRLTETTDAGDRRYERKFLIEDENREMVEMIIRHHPSFFSEIYHRRWVNNIYLDTPTLDNYNDNVSGVGHHRLKVRIRWYGGLRGEIETPVLEFKIKRGVVNWKVSYPLPSFALDGAFSSARLRQLVRTAKLPIHVAEHLMELVPTLVNRYRRQYFQSRCRGFRATVDSRLTFHDVDDAGTPSLCRRWGAGVMVLELKYAEAVDHSAPGITQHFPFRLTRSSKYVSGIDSTRMGSGTNPYLRQDRSLDER